MIKTPHNPRTGIQFKNCRFDAGEGAEALKVVEAFILAHRRYENPKPPYRRKLSKIHNYKFNYRNR